MIEFFDSFQRIINDHILAYSLILSDNPCSQLLHPEFIPYGHSHTIASTCLINPFSILNNSAISHVHGRITPMGIVIIPFVSFMLGIFPA